MSECDGKFTIQMQLNKNKHCNIPIMEIFLFYFRVYFACANKLNELFELN